MSLYEKGKQQQEDREGEREGERGAMDVDEGDIEEYTATVRRRVDAGRREDALREKERVKAKRKKLKEAVQGKKDNDDDDDDEGSRVAVLAPYESGSDSGSDSNSDNNDAPLRKKHKTVTIAKKKMFDRFERADDEGEGGSGGVSSDSGSGEGSDDDDDPAYLERKALAIMK